MKTHEVEDMLGVTKQALIYYEKEGLIHPQRLNNRYRDYTQKDIDILKLILLLRSMEISIDEIKLILNDQLSIREALQQKQDFIHDSQKGWKNLIKEFMTISKEGKSRYPFIIKISVNGKTMIHSISMMDISNIMKFLLNYQTSKKFKFLCIVPMAFSMQVLVHLGWLVCIFNILLI